MPVLKQHSDQSSPIAVVPLTRTPRLDGIIHAGKKSVLRHLLVGILIVGAGCGGGGSGESPIPPPPPPPFGFSADNVPTASRITLDLIEHAYDGAQQAIEASEASANSFLDRFKVVCDSDSPDAATVASIDDNDASDNITDGDAIHVRLENCGDTTSELSLQVDSIHTLNFELLSLSGSITFSIKASAQSDAATIAGYMGSFSLDHMKTADETTLSMTDIEASMVMGGMTDRLESGRLQESITGLDYLVEFAGSLESDELGGTFDFETGTAFGGSLGSFPTAGELMLLATNSSARVTPSANPELHEHADYQVDPGRTGQYSEAVSVRWLDWISGSLFRWYPLIRGLSIVPRHPDSRNSLSADFRIYSPQGGSVSITYEWRVNGSVLLGQTSGYLFPDSTSKHDVVEIRVTASAGEHTVTLQASVTIRNKLPDVQAMLSPERPDTRDDIVLIYSVNDLDGDEVETNIQWNINDSVVTDLETATLPADRHRKNDVVRVLITANDGESETSRELEVSIQDAIPDIDVSGVPETVNYGERVQFDATVSDVDDDDLSTFRFDLVYGPVGMTVDPVSGQVQWDASLPMFDRNIDIGWNIGSSSGPAEMVSGVLRVEDPDRQYPFMVSGANSVFRGGTRVADIDGDGADDMLVVNDLGHVYTIGWDGKILRETWTHPFAINTHSGIEAASSGDIDGDGRHEIFLMGNYNQESDSLIRLDGLERQIVASATVPLMIDSGIDIQFADLDNDGAFELIYMAVAFPLHHSRIVVLSAENLNLLWESPPDYLGKYVKIGNVDDDPALEIIVSGGHVFDGVTYEREWSHVSAYSANSAYHHANSISAARGLFVSDMDGDGIDEIIGKLNHDDRDADVEVYSIANGKILGNARPIPFALFNFRTGNALVADIDDDGMTEVLGFSLSDSRMSAYRYSEPTDEFLEVFSQERNSKFHAPIGVGDFDGDGETEIALFGKSGSGNVNTTGIGRIVVAGLNPEFEVEWTESNVRVFDGGFAGGRPVRDQNMTQRGLLFVLWGASIIHSDGPRAIFLSPATGEFMIGPRVDVGVPDHFYNYRSPISGVSISDYDSDGVFELLMSMSSIDQPYVVYDPFREVAEWSSNTLSGNFVSAVDLNGDGFEDFLTHSTGYDIVNSEVIWEPQLPPYIVQSAAGDLDGDGIAEIVGIEQNSEVVVVYARTENQDDYSRSVLLNTQPQSSIKNTDLVVSDMDSDGKAEIVLLTSSLTNVRRFGSDLEMLNSFSVKMESRFHDRPDRLFIVPGGGGKEHLLVAFHLDSLAETSKLVAFDPATGHKIWESPRLFGRVLPNSVHYFTESESGEPRLAIGTSKAMYVTR